MTRNASDADGSTEDPTGSDRTTGDRSAGNRTARDRSTGREGSSGGRTVPDGGQSSPRGATGDGHCPPGEGGSPTFEHDALFDPDVYLPTVEELLGPERADADAEFLATHLDPSAGDRVLDAPCGHGRHANRLAERGYEVAGLDRSGEFLDRARADARERGVADAVEYVEGDLRELPWADDEFDAAYNVFTSFGFFDEAGNRRVLAELARVLRPGGRLVMEMADKEAMLSDYRPESVTELDEGYVAETREYDPVTARNRTERVTVLDGEVRESTYEVRVYGYRELKWLLADAGFRVLDLFGNMDGDDYSLETGRLCVVAERT